MSVKILSSNKIEKEKKQLAKEAGMLRVEVQGTEVAEEMEKERRMFQLQMCEVRSHTQSVDAQMSAVDFRSPVVLVHVPCKENNTCFDVRKREKLFWEVLYSGDRSKWMQLILLSDCSTSSK